MEADWYVDPLGRYEGRYFDGNEWTDQVKEEGRLAVDPDWNRPSPSRATDAGSAAESAPPAVESDQAASVGAFFGRTSDDDDVVDAEIVATSTTAAHDRDPVEAEAVPADYDRSGPQAVEPVAGGAFSEASAASDSATDFTSESPTRQVAVLGDRAGSGAPTEPVFDFGSDKRGGSRRWLYVLGAIALAAALAIVLLPRLFGGDDEVAGSADTEDVAQVEADAGESDGDADVGLLPPAGDTGDTGDAEDTVDPDSAMSDSDAEGSAETDDVTDSSSEGAETPPRALAGPDSIPVGSLEVLNGKPLLVDLSGWHRSSLGAAVASLPDDATCWFGRLGEAVVQNAHCGPVAASTDAEVRFDLIPLKFEDISEGVIQVRALTDAVISDAVLPNGLILVGPDGELDPSTFETAEEDPPADEPADDEPADDEPADDEAPAEDEPADEAPAEEEAPSERGTRGGRGERTVEDE